MDFEVAGAVSAGALDVLGLNVLAAAPDLARDIEERFELVGDRGFFGRGLDVENEFLVAFEMVRGDGSVHGVAEEAVVFGWTRGRR